jgi:uncharacterized protein YcbK (DUF882 family)
MAWRYFTSSEFDDPTLPGSGSNMDPAFVDILDRIRGLAGFPMRVTSGYRTPEHNTEAGGVSHSAHLRGHAADIAVSDSASRYTLVRTALALGITRIGIGKNIVHLDNDPSLPQDVIWTYYP